MDRFDITPAEGARAWPLVNYHTHTWRCQHARGTELEYVETAIAQGFQALGFADHTPWPYESDFVSGMRMRLDQFDGYRRTLLALRDRFAGRIAMPLGLECEAFPEYMGWLRDFKAKYLDYAILGNHYDYSDDGDHTLMYPDGGFYFGRCTRPDAVRRYGERTLFGMKTGLFDCLAHPDLFLHTYPEFDADCRAVSRDICQAAKQLDMPLEFNLLGFSRHAQELDRGWQGYPNPDFWEIAAECGCRAIVGFDAHEPEALERMDLSRAAHCILDDLHIETLDHLPGIK